jgi:choice-of-anchor A domain-containing protein
MNISLFSRGAFVAQSILFVICSILFGRVEASAQVLTPGLNLGAAWQGPDGGIFLLGNGDGANTIDGSSRIFGNLSVGGLDEISIKGRSTIGGNLTIGNPAALTLSGNGHVLGNINSGPSVVPGLQQGVADAMGASQFAFGLQETAGLPTTINTRRNLTLAGTGTVVLKLDDFQMSGNAALTLQGDVDTTFIINVNDKFTMGGNTRITLSGGLTWDNVLFNIIGDGDATLSGNAQLEGIILATERTLKLSGKSEVRGEIIAGAVKMSGAAVVGRAPIVSP